MQIINPLNKDEDIEKELRRIFSSDDRLEVFKGQRLLELVRYLQAEGPPIQVGGHFMFGKLSLSQWDTSKRVFVDIWGDWFDYAPLCDGLPESHYRFQIHHADAEVTTDARVVTVEEAEEVARQAFLID